MKDKDLEKLKIYKIATIALIITTVLSNGIGILTSGFTAWEKIFPKNDINPLISLRIEPLVIDYENAYDYKINKLLYFELETSGGVYKINDGISLDSLIIIKPDYIIPDVGNLSIELKSLEIDKTILNQTTPNVNGFVKVDYNFVLNANSLIGMNDGDEVQIAYFDIKIPYEFNGKNFIEKRRIPLIVKK